MKESFKPRIRGRFSSATTVALVSLFLFALLARCKKEAEIPPDQQLTANKSGINAAPAKVDIIVRRGTSIQSAIDAAHPGSVISIQPGIYNEAVIINKKDIFLNGSGEGVVIQNPGGIENGITVMDNANNVVIKNITVKNFEENGILLTHVKGFLISNVTAINNGEYGIFPVYCEDGVIDHCFASGHTDTGIYVGQSKNVLMTLNKATGNVNGLEIENCTNVAATKNESYGNTGGMLIVLLPGLTVKSSANILVNENYVHDNNLPNFAPPGGGFEIGVPAGSGVLVVGVDNVIVRDNKISNNGFVGTAVVSTLVLGGLFGLPPEAFADIEPNADGAKIIGNEYVHNGFAPPPGLPLPAVDLLWDGTGINNCWKNNIFSSSYPSSLPECL
jgi:parallel beta-helix repeat-containing protein